MSSLKKSDKPHHKCWYKQITTNPFIMVNDESGWKVNVVDGSIRFSYIMYYSNLGEDANGYLFTKSL